MLDKIIEVYNKHEKKIAIVIGLIIVIWPLVFLNKGIDVTDTGYVLSKYKYVFTQQSLNTFRILFSELTGGILYKIAPSHQLLFLNLCGYISYLLIGTMTYSMFKEYMNKNLLLVAILIASFFTKRYLTIISYNTFTALVLCLGIYLLINALKKDNDKMLFFSGVVLASSMFFRLPNILQLSLVLVIVWYYYFCLKNTELTKKKLYVFFAGVSSSFFIAMTIAIYFLGWNNIILENSATAKLSVSDDSHGIVNMLYRILAELKVGIVVLIKIFCGLISLIFFSKVLKFIANDKFIMTLTGIFVIIFSGIIAFMKMDYSTYLYILSVLSITLSIYFAFKYRKKKSTLSTLITANLIVALIIPLGTDNGLGHYATFLYLPLVTIFCILFLELQEYYKTNKKVFFDITYALMLFLLLTGLITGFNLATKYVYRDAPNHELKYSVNSSVYYGMKTSQERSKALNNFVEIMKLYKDQELLSYGEFTIGFLLTDMKPFFKTVWPDLASFSLATFQQQLQEKEQLGIRPVIVLVSMEEKDFFRDYNKLALIMKFIAVHDYKIQYKDEYFTIYVPNI